MKKISKLFWFLNKPEYFFVLFEILKNKFLLNKKDKLHSLQICRKKNISHNLFKKKFFLNKKKFNLNKHIDYKHCYKIVKNNRRMLDGAQNFGLKKPIISMKNFISKSGASNIQLIFEIIRKERPKNIVETGVAYGWSSYAILLAIRENKFGKLFSIDLPYPFLNEKSKIGILVPKKLRKNWKIVYCRDKIGILKAIKKFNYKIDFFHYDSDKNYKAKLKNLKTIWKYIQPNGIVICDDINDNLAFFDFVNNIKKKYYVVKTGNKFLGIVKNA